MKRLGSLVMGLIVLHYLLPATAGACSCLTVPSPHGAAEGVDVVFVGKASKVERIPADGWLYGIWKQIWGAEHLYEYETLRVTMDVETPIKGVDGSQVTVETFASTEICGVLFQEGENYLVYAYNGPAGIVTTDMCTRTASAKKAAADIQALVSKEIKPVCEGWTCINE